MRYTTSASEIFDDLCYKIRRLELEPGSMISENEIAILYNVSRSTVRTAFSKLEQINLISRFPQVGTFINTFDLDYIASALHVRNLVEMDVVENVIKLEDKTELIKALEENIKLQVTFRNKMEYEAGFSEADSRFHNIIIESAGKRKMMEIIHDSFIHIARWKNFDIKHRNKINRLIDDHIGIYEAIKNNDVEMAKKVLTKHLITVDDEFVAYAKRNYPNYF